MSKEMESTPLPGSVSVSIWPAWTDRQPVAYSVRGQTSRWSGSTRKQVFACRRQSWGHRWRIKVLKIARDEREPEGGESRAAKLTCIRRWDCPKGTEGLLELASLRWSRRNRRIPSVHRRHKLRRRECHRNIWFISSSIGWTVHHRWPLPSPRAQRNFGF